MANSNPHADELRGYRAISLLAPITALLGIASVLALIHPLLWIVPLFAIVIGTIALRQISTNPEMIGRKAVLFGLMLALFLGTFSPARLLTRQWMLSYESRRIASDWLELVRQGRLEEAHQWTLRPTDRQATDVSLDKYYESSGAALKDLDDFFNREIIERFRSVAQVGKIRFERKSVVAHANDADHVAHHFAVSKDVNGQSECVQIVTALKRSLNPRTRAAYWVVENVSEPDAE